MVTSIRTTLGAQHNAKRANFGFRHCSLRSSIGHYVVLISHAHEEIIEYV